MQELLIYLFKSAGLLSLFYAAYFFLLKKDTSFNANRFFLMAGILTSFLLPFLEISRSVEVEATTTPILLNNFSSELISSPTPAPSETDWWYIAGIFYLIGFGIFLLKFLWELFSLLKFLITHKKQKEGKFNIIQKNGITQPFSFFNYIVLDRDQHTAGELDLILKHERSHARQWHSIDQLVTSLGVYLLWFNPLAWLYKRSVVQNLEYLADKEVLDAKVSKKEYQKTLLKISVGNFEPALTNNFYQSFIKKRIMMLNKNSSQKSHFWKVSLLLPFLVLFIFSFNVKTVAQVKGAGEKSTSSSHKKLHFAIITKEATEQDLEKLAKDFSENGITLKFTKVERTGSGVITNLAINFKNENTGDTGNINQNSAEGIPGLTITFDKGEFSFKTIAESSSQVNSKSGFTEKIGVNPLIILNGKRYRAAQISGKFIHVQGELSSLNPSEGKSQYGNEAEDGVLMIPKGTIGNDFQQEMKRLDKEEKDFFGHYLQFRANQKPVFVTVDRTSNSGNDVNSTSKKQLKGSGKKESNKSRNPLSEIGNSPLYIIAGKEYSALDLTEQYIQITGKWNALPPGEAVQKYGKKAKDGAILVSEGHIVSSFKEGLKQIDLQKANVHQTFIHVPKETPPVLQSVKTEIKKGDFQNPSNFENQDINFHKEPEDIIAIQTQNQSSTFFTFQKNNPLLIINGKVQDEDFDPSGLNPSTIESILIFKDQDAVEKYGEEGKNGVVEIQLLKGEGQKMNKGEEDKSDAKDVHFTIRSSVPSFSEKKRLSVRDVGSADPDNATPLYIVNGKIMPQDFDPQSILPENIESASVLKGGKATAKYGEKAKHGAIEIITKD